MIFSPRIGNRHSCNSEGRGEFVPVTTKSALAATDLYKSFGSTQALQGATLKLDAGRVRALLGENGSGKSTFAKIIAGTLSADAGTICRDGQNVIIGDPVTARQLGIAMVFQELSIVPDLDLADNVFLGRERKRWLGLVDRKDEEAACRAVLNRIGLAHSPSTPARGLSMAQKQLLEIGKAMSNNPKVLVLDEPTASLTRLEIEQLFTLIHQLRDGGTAILYVTHHLREVLEIANDVSIMRNGRIVADRAVTKATTEEDLVELLIGKKPRPHLTGTAAGVGAPLLEVVDLPTSNGREVSFHINHGEIVGLYGIVGCGREEIGHALIGSAKKSRGDCRMSLGGEDFEPHDPAEALSCGVGFLASDRKQAGILPNRAVRENLMLSSLARIAHYGILNHDSERNIAAKQLDALGVKYSSIEDSITVLSGGNQQKVLFGRALSVEPKLLVLEDPTAGIDIGAKGDLYEIIRAQAREGRSFLWMSSDITETLTLCDRVYAMYDGRIVNEFISPSMADEEDLLAAVLGRGYSARAQPQA
jgi:ribose transport system ATP-binding protein